MVVNSNGYAVDDGRPVVVSTSALVYLLVSWAARHRRSLQRTLQYHRSQCLTEADGHYARARIGTVDNNATLATCDFIYFLRSGNGGFQTVCIHSRHRHG